MSIIDFFKKKFGKKEAETSEKKAVEFGGLKLFIDSEKKSIKNSETEFVEQIKSIVLGLINELEDGLGRIKSIDLSEKRESEKMKFVVRENLHYFIRHMEKLICDLKSVNYNSIKEIKKTINAVFLDFERKSIRNYQKSTILIGEELGNIKDSISKFFGSFKKIIEKNDGTIEKSSIFESAAINILEYNHLEQEGKKIEEEIKKYSEKISDCWAGISQQNEKIERLEENEEYKQFLEAKKMFEERKNKFDLELFRIKSLIDFKALAGFYHSEEKKMNLVKEYRDNFRDSFFRYSPETLTELIEGGGFNIHDIKDKISGAKSIQEILSKAQLPRDPSLDLNSEIDKIKFQKMILRCLL
jgi:hypothetical protein